MTVPTVPTRSYGSGTVARWRLCRPCPLREGHSAQSTATESVQRLRTLSAQSEIHTRADAELVR